MNSFSKNSGTVKISVVIPVYNAQKYLDKCIGSVLAQTFSDFELILVNDGSKDGSLEICRRYESKDSRVRVFDKPNGGVSSARNFGLDNAAGEWIAFIDSDDWVDPDYLSHMYAAVLENEKTDLVVSGRRTIYPTHKTELVFSPELCDAKRAYAQKKLYKFGSPVHMLYSKAVVDSFDLRYDPSLSFGEDLLFMAAFLSHIRRAAFVESCDYNYNCLDTVGHLSHRHHSYEKEYSFFESFYKWAVFFTGEDSMPAEIFEYAAGLLYRSVFSMYRKGFKLSKSERMENLAFLASEWGGILKKTKLHPRYSLWLLSGSFKRLDFVLSLLFSLRYGILGSFWKLALKLKGKRAPASFIRI